jgi:hypothetical protein
MPGWGTRVIRWILGKLGKGPAPAPTPPRVDPTTSYVAGDRQFRSPQ